MARIRDIAHEVATIVEAALVPCVTESQCTQFVRCEDNSSDTTWGN